MFFNRFMSAFNMNNRSNRGSRSNCYSYKLVSFEQAKNMIETQEVILIDVRTESEYNLMHIKNAINIPVDTLLNKISDGTIDKEKNIMVYCSSGARSKKAIQLLNKFGYNIYIWEYAALATFPYRNMLVYQQK